MKRRFGIVLVIIALALGSFLFWLYHFFGLKEYVRAASSIRGLPGEKRAQASSNFLGSGEEDKYGGILAAVNQQGPGGVWMWTRGGLKYFRADEYSVFSYFNICDDQVRDALESGDKVTVDRSLDSDIKIWAEKAKRGNYVFVQLSDQRRGGTLGNLREIKAHDWWAFMPSFDIRKQCEN